MAPTHVTAVATAAAPAAVGPYSQGVSTGETSGSLVFVSGQIPLDPATGALVEGDVAAQAEQVLRNLGAILAEAGLGYDDVVKTTVLLADIADFAAVNEVYARFFGGAQGPGGAAGSDAAASPGSSGEPASPAGSRSAASSSGAVLPARAAFGVAALPLGARVEVEAVAVRP